MQPGFYSCANVPADGKEVAFRLAPASTDRFVSVYLKPDDGYTTFISSAYEVEDYFTCNSPQVVGCTPGNAGQPSVYTFKATANKAYAVSRERSSSCPGSVCKRLINACHPTTLSRA